MHKILLKSSMTLRKCGSWISCDLKSRWNKRPILSVRRRHDRATFTRLLSAGYWGRTSMHYFFLQFPSVLTRYLKLWIFLTRYKNRRIRFLASIQGNSEKNKYYKYKDQRCHPSGACWREAESSVGHSRNSLVLIRLCGVFDMLGIY